MNKIQILLLVLASVAIIGLYQLPRVVVENEQLASIETHDLSTSAEDEAVFSSLRQLLNTTSEIKKSINFADSLAELYLKYQMIDSAAKYADYILSLDDSRLASYTGALIYYRAFQMSNSPEQSRVLAGRAEQEFRSLLVDDSENSLLKNKLAMTLMVTEAPMVGVQMLREILEEDPNNRETILNLGLLAIRSRQYDKAIGRFETLMELDPNDYESLFYLGVSQIEIGDTLAGKKAFEKIVDTEGVDAALKATASTYIQDL
ncbi:MAG: tetratricopeptide repeat protein [Cyclobacteriaceae bacterium]